MKVQNVLKKAVDSVLAISGPIEFIAVSFVLVWQMAFTCLLPLETIEFVTMVQLHKSKLKHWGRKSKVESQSFASDFPYVIK